MLFILAIILGILFLLFILMLEEGFLLLLAVAAVIGGLILYNNTAPHWNPDPIVHEHTYKLTDPESFRAPKTTTDKACITLEAEKYGLPATEEKCFNADRYEILHDMPAGEAKAVEKASYNQNRWFVPWGKRIAEWWEIHLPETTEKASK